MLYNYKKVVLAGGCFWGVEKLFKKLKGVVNTEVGYTGGDIINPTYSQICKGTTGHAEAVEITYDINLIKFEGVLKFFFRIHDPTILNRQKNDIGPQYRSAIFVYSEVEKQKAMKIINQINQANIFDNQILTEVKVLDKFYTAEDYHQDYLDKNPGGYNCHVYQNIDFGF